MCFLFCALDGGRFWRRVRRLMRPHKHLYKYAQAYTLARRMCDELLIASGRTKTAPQRSGSIFFFVSRCANSMFRAHQVKCVYAHWNNLIVRHLTLVETIYAKNNICHLVLTRLGHLGANKKINMISTLHARKVALSMRLRLCSFKFGWKHNLEHSEGL